MKVKEEVSCLMAKLTLKNNLDQEDEEEGTVESVVVLNAKDSSDQEDAKKEEEHDEYASKGPVRGNNLHQSRNNPYQMPNSHVKISPVASIQSKFIDDEDEMEFIMSRMGLPSTPPPETNDDESGIPDLPKMEKKAQFKPVVLMQDKDADYETLDLGLSIVLDKALKKMGIWIPETVLNDNMKVDLATLSVEVYIKLNGPNKSRMVNYMATIKKDQISGKAMLTRQFVELAPMIHAGASDLTCDIDPAVLQSAIDLVSGKNVTDLLKTYGPNDESLLMTLCCQKNDSPPLRAQVFAFLSRVLDESNQEAINMIIKKNQLGLSALDYATMANNAKIAAFLAKMFYMFGQDVLGKDSQGNTVLHMMARKGDLVASTLNTLMTVYYAHHNNNQRVYPTNVKNTKHEMPIHIAAMNKKCAPHIVQLLVKDCPGGLRSATIDGSLPIHLACQFSSDPNLLSHLLYFDKSMVNSMRGDGFTPLHLVAARGDVHDVKLGLIRLDENTQVRMIQILLEHGGDKTTRVEDMYLPVDLLGNERAKAKELLNLAKQEKKSNEEDRGYSVMTPSPSVGSEFNNDPYMNGGTCGSPAYSCMSNQTGVPSPNVYSNMGSVTSNFTGSDEESDEDNCAPSKMVNGRNPIEAPNEEDFDIIAKVLYNHPTIQAVMANDF